MKRIALIAACAMLGACASVKPPTMADVCPPVKADLKALQAPGILSADQNVKLTKDVVPLVDAVCATDSTLTFQNLSAFNATAYPELIGIVNASSLPNKSDIALGLTLAQPFVQQVVDSAAIPTIPSAPAVAPQ